MTPLPLSPPEGSGSPPLSQGGARPERSRNAKAQARHRAKRKAYIKQLEQMVSQLQHTLSLSPDNVAVRIRELEEQNRALLRQIDDIQAQLEDEQCGGSRNTMHPVAYIHPSTIGTMPSFNGRDDHGVAKRRHTVEGSGDLALHHRPSQSSLQTAIPHEYLLPPQPSQQSPMPAPYTLQYHFPEPHHQHQQQQQHEISQVEAVH